MRKALKFLLELAVALILMLCFRALVFTIYTVVGPALSPLLIQGDRVLVNRWSYGLRVGSDEGLIGYTRIGRQLVGQGDVVAFENPKDPSEVLICRCHAGPGDTIHHDNQVLIVPGRVNCAPQDHYWMEALSPLNTIDSRTLGLIPEQFIIGRVTTIVYSHNPAELPWNGWRHYRTLLPL